MSFFNYFFDLDLYVAMCAWTNFTYLVRAQITTCYYKLYQCIFVFKCKETVLNMIFMYLVNNWFIFSHGWRTNVFFRFAFWINDIRCFVYVVILIINVIYFSEHFYGGTFDQFSCRGSSPPEHPSSAGACIWDVPLQMFLQPPMIVGSEITYWKWTTSCRLSMWTEYKRDAAPTRVPVSGCCVCVHIPMRQPGLSMSLVCMTVFAYSSTRSQTVFGLHRSSLSEERSQNWTLMTWGKSCLHLRAPPEP